MPVLFGSLFTGIGGFDLGFERAGFKCAWQVELDPFRGAVLRKWWPGVPRWRDVRSVETAELSRVPIICGGFPCQDVAAAGKREGICGARSGLWFHMHRIVRALRPQFVIVENTPGLLHRGLGVVLGGLASLGYDAEWDCISAARFGSSQARSRIYIVAYPRALGLSIFRPAHHDDGKDETGQLFDRHPPRVDHAFPSGPSTALVSPQPFILRSASRIPDKSHRIAALGDSVIPQVAEYIGRRIISELRRVRRAA